MDLAQSKDEQELSLLMRKSQDGDAESYRRLLTKVQEMLATYVNHSLKRFRLGSKEAQDDVLQEILLALHQKRATYDPEQFFLPWLYAIARYKVIDYLRRQKLDKRSTVPLNDELESMEIVMSFEMSSSLDLETLCNSLPEKQKEILLLVKLEGLSIEETAKKTGFSPSDVKVSVHRAIKALRKKIEEKEEESKK